MTLLGGRGRHFVSSDFTPALDYKRFVVTTEDGTRYVFAQPTLGTFHGLDPFDNARPERMAERFVSAWRLTAILGADYTGERSRA